MNITHTWIIKSLKQVNDGTGLVTSVGFKVVSRDTETSTAVSVYENVTLDIEGIDMSSITPYSELTQEQVIQFVKDKLGDQAQSLENDNANAIKTKIAPPTPSIIVESLPWS
jgi:hypothetical protein